MFHRLFNRRGPGFCAPSALFGVDTSLAQSLPRNYTSIDRQRDFQAVLRATPAGRRVFAQIVERSHAVERSYVPGDSLETARREGMRDIGLWLIEIVRDDRVGKPLSAEAEAPDDAVRRSGGFE